jgi:surface polysaccharide O-acyltransferase-like enzyme
MVVGHTLDAVLWEPARQTALFAGYSFSRGFTAPLFLVVSGFSFSLVSERRWEAYLALGADTRRRLGRIALLLLLGYALHLPYLSLEKLLFAATDADLLAFLQADVLQCTAVGLLALQLLLVVTRRPARFAACAAAIGALLVLATPLVWSIDFGKHLPAALTPYLSTRTPSLFPIFPFLGYLFLGAALGHRLNAARAVGRDGPWLNRMAALGAVLVLLGIGACHLPWSLHSEKDFWQASPCIVAIRMGGVLLIMRAVFALRAGVPWGPSALGLLGRSSLLVYVAHLVVVYGSAASLGFAQRTGRIIPTLDALVLALFLVAAMWLLAWIADFVRRDYRPVFRLTQAGLGTALVYLFLTRPY